MKTVKVAKRSSTSILDELDEAIVSLRRSGDQGPLSPSLRFQVERLEREAQFRRGRMNRQICSVAG